MQRDSNKSLQILFLSFLIAGKLHRKLKEDTIHKGGSRSIVKDDRLLSRTFPVSKIMKLIFRGNCLRSLKIMRHSLTQGLCSERNCYAQLLKHYNWILKQVMTHSSTVMIYLDFVKTFDNVDHGRYIASDGNLS